MARRYSKSPPVEVSLRELEAEFDLIGLELVKDPANGDTFKPIRDDTQFNRSALCRYLIGLGIDTHKRRNAQAVRGRPTGPRRVFSRDFVLIIRGHFNRAEYYSSLDAVEDRLRAAARSAKFAGFEEGTLQPGPVVEQDIERIADHLMEKVRACVEREPPKPLALGGSVYRFEAYHEHIIQAFWDLIAELDASPNGSG